MAISDSSWLMSYNDMYLLAIDGFQIKNTFDYNSYICVTKTQAQYHLYLQTAPMDGVADDQLVWRSLFVKPADPVDNPPNAPTNLALSARTQTYITFSYLTGVDDKGITAVNHYWINPSNGYTELLRQDSFTVNSPTTRTFTVQGLSAGTSYTFYASMIDTIGQESSLSSITLSTEAENPADYDACVDTSDTQDSSITICLGSTIRIAAVCADDDDDRDYATWSYNSDGSDAFYTGMTLTITPSRTVTIYRFLRYSWSPDYRKDKIVVTVINC